jgi:sigma-54 dependent transcriptional regulator, acetoin dehydrogenase operon transcriptional activator AcoR
MVRAEIAASWRRTLLCGLPEDTDLDQGPTAEVNRSTRLLAAAGPVLDQVAEELADSRYAIMLADSAARLVDIRFGTRSLRARMENTGARLGCRFLEETSGTNAIAVVFEIRHGISVHGEEHYVEKLRPFSCYGHPVIDHATGRLAGILDITCPQADDNVLLAPFLVRAAREIEHRLLDSARETEQRLLAAFRLASIRRGAGAVVALGSDFVLANEVASRTLDAADHVALAGLAEQADPGRKSSRQLQLTSGRPVLVRWHTVDERAGVVFEIRPDATSPRTPTPSATRPSRAAKDDRAPVLVSGEPGSGRSTAARAVLENADDEAEPLRFYAAGVAISAAELFQALATPVDVVIEDIHRLTPVLAGQLASALDTTAARVVLTCGPMTGLRDEHQALAARCPIRIELPPLRSRPAEIPELVRTMLHDLRADPGVRFTAEALDILARQPWPGNLTELRSVVAAAARHAAGDVTAADLPITTRPRTPHRLSLIEQAECSTIQHALLVCDGNKRAAARMLSISPTTLYKRMRTFGLSGPRRQQASTGWTVRCPDRP